MKTIPEIICCPSCGSTLKVVQQNNSQTALHCKHCNVNYPNKEGFIEFITDEQVFKFSKRTELMRSVYAKFYTPLTNLMFLPCGGVKKARKEVLDELEVKPGDKILETGIGTGDNIIYMNGLMDQIDFYGLDNQVRMVKACESNLKKWKQSAYLCRANAEYLPFQNDSFDVVFHLGAINLFEDKKHAIDEMIRVAKPGTKIVIADESEKASRLFALFTGKQEPVVPPVNLISKTMHEIELKTIWRGYGYIITFRKPAEKPKARKIGKMHQPARNQLNYV